MSRVTSEADLPRLSAGTCHVWWARPSTREARLAGLLDPDERRRLDSLRRPVDRKRFLTACALLRLVLHRVLDEPPDRIDIVRTCSTCGGPHGKPRLPSGRSPVEMSVSHSGERVVVAVAWKAPVGVDVEAAPRDLAVDDLISQLLTAAEARDLDAVPKQLRMTAVLRYWTRKEATLKATGAGLRTGLTSFAVTPPGHSPAVTLWSGPEPAASFSLRDLDPGRGHVASLAMLGPMTCLVEVDGSSLLGD